jgi:hypothetical protein
MAKSIKFTNDTYLDSNSVSYKKTNLETTIDNLKNSASKITLLKSFSYTTFSGGNLGVNMSGYDLIVLVTSRGTVINPSGYYMRGTIFSEDWYDDADQLIRRQFYAVNNDIYLGPCYGYGINGYSKFDTKPTEILPVAVYGIKF